MVVNIISLPGVMSAEMVEKFKLKIEQAAGKSLSKQVEDRRALQKKLSEGFKSESLSSATPQRQKKEARSESPEKLDNRKNIDGYKMEEIKTEDESTALSSSGIQWFASLFIVFLIVFFVYGVKGRGRK
jgi:cobaltochelatase CobN